VGELVYETVPHRKYVSLAAVSSTGVAGVLRYQRTDTTISEMLFSAKSVAPILAVAGSLALLSAGGVPADAVARSAGPAPTAAVSARLVLLPASTSVSGKVRARLSKKSFAAAEARSVKLAYSFAPASKRFSYQLSRQTGAQWVKLRAVARMGRFGGSYSKSVKSIFGSKPVTAASYHLDLSADANRVRLGFRIVPSAPLPTKPAKPVKLIFIHHSTGQNWLADDNGGLGIELKNNNYFVSDTNYGWGPDVIGDRTDTGNWWDWFRGPKSNTYMQALYTEFGQLSGYTRLSSDPDSSRENEIVMFKSCFPSSAIDGNPDDPAKAGNNPLRGGGPMTVANVKGIYNDILTYFAAHQDKLFVLIVPPPLVESATNSARAANARAVANWLVNKWLSGYTHNNVAVFDFYNVLTSNGGSANKNDLGASGGNHHRWWNGSVQHSKTGSSNFLAYPTGDSHPSQAGNRKATAEFVPLLNYYYQRWAAGK
jgi:hypothetical protein